MEKYFRKLEKKILGRPKKGPHIIWVKNPEQILLTNSEKIRKILSKKTNENSHNLNETN